VGIVSITLSVEYHSPSYAVVFHCCGRRSGIDLEFAARQSSWPISESDPSLNISSRVTWKHTFLVKYWWDILSALEIFMRCAI